MGAQVEGVAVLLTTMLASVVLALWGFDYAEKVGDSRNLIPAFVFIMTWVAGTMWFLAVTI